jgi:hypothetical protein
MTMRENSKSPGLAELIRMAIKQNQAEIHVSLPGRIESYDVSQQTADIQPLLQRVLVDEDGTELDPETLPILHDVPIAFPRGGGCFLSWPLAEGDLVQLFFIERSIDQYLGGNGEITEPLDYRMHNLSDAVAYPGCYPRALALSDAHAENAVWGIDGGLQIHVKSGEIDIGSENAADFVALAQKVFDEIDALKTTLNNFITAHNAPGSHTTTATVGPSAVPGVITPFVGTSHGVINSVAADKVKAD